MGNQPNPFASLSATTASTDQPLLNRVLPVLAHTMSGIFHAPRRAVEMMLQVVTATIRFAEQMVYRRARTSLLQEYPEADEGVLTRFDAAANPVSNPPAADGTL